MFGMVGSMSAWVWARDLLKYQGIRQEQGEEGHSTLRPIESISRNVPTRLELWYTGETHTQTHRQTSWLLDRIGPVGRFDENIQILQRSFGQIKRTAMWLLNQWFGTMLFFAMAKIRRIGHDHQLPSFSLLVVVVVVLGFQAWHEAKTSCHMHNTPWTPNIFTYSGPPIKWPLGGLIKGAPHPPDPPPPMGEPKYFLGGYYWWTIQTPIELNILGSSWLKYIYNFSYASRGARPPDPLSP